METIIYEVENATLKYDEEDEFTSIDYEVETNDDGDFIGGNFLFEQDDALNAYGFSNNKELISYCKQLIKGSQDVEEMWHKIMDDFEAHGIDVSPDEYEGGSNFMTNI